MSIPALTLWQPWASLVAVGAKPYEWRGWEAPKRLVGKRIAIHAASRKVKRNEIAELMIDVRRDPAMTSLDAAIALPLLERWNTSPGALPVSSVLCIATLGQPVTALQYAREKGIGARDSDRVDHQKWGWPLYDIEVLNPFVPATGAQGFWDWKRQP